MFNPRALGSSTSGRARPRLVLGLLLVAAFLALSAGAVVSLALGSAWSAPVDLSSAMSRWPQVGVDGAGNTVAVWEHITPLITPYSGDERTVQAAIRPAGSAAFGAPVDLAAPVPNGSELVPALAVNGEGDAIVVWVSGGSVYAASKPAGAPEFGAAVAVGSGAAASALNFAEPAVALDAHGGAVVVWYHASGTRYQFEASIRRAGGSFGSPAALDAPGPGVGVPDRPRVAMDSPGDAVVLFVGESGTHTVVRAARRPAGGAFGAPVDLSDPAQYANTPALAMNGSGDAVAVWKQDGGSGTSGVIEAASARAGGAFASPVAVSPPGGDEHPFPSVAVNSQGAALVAWDEKGLLGDPVQVARRADAGAPFGEVSTLTPVLSSGQAPAVALDDYGDAIVAWETKTSYGISLCCEFTAEEVDGAASVQGGPFGAPIQISKSGEDSESPQVSFGPSDTAVAAFHDVTTDVTQVADYRGPPPPPPVVATAQILGPSSAAPSTPVMFRAVLSKGSGAHYYWDFDGSGRFATDGGTSPVIAHGFTQPGAVTIGLKVVDAQGQSAYATLAFRVDAMPHAELFFAPGHPRVGQRIHFFVRPRPGGNRHVLLYLWQFGDRRRVPHTLTLPCVSSACHPRSSAANGLRHLRLPSQRLILSRPEAALSGLDGLTPRFTAATGLSFGRFLEPSTGAALTHVYDRAGSYRFLLNMIFSDGARETMPVAVDVCPDAGSCASAPSSSSLSVCAVRRGKNGSCPLGKSYQYKPTVGVSGDPVEGNPVHFSVYAQLQQPKNPQYHPKRNCGDVSLPDCTDTTDLAPQTPPNQHWDFGDGTTADTTSGVVDHAFPATGGPATYTVTVTTTEADGTSGPTAQTTETIYPPPAPECGTFDLGGFSASLDDGSCLTPASFSQRLYSIPEGHTLTVNGVTFDGGQVDFDQPAVFGKDETYYVGQTPKVGAAAVTASFGSLKIGVNDRWDLSSGTVDLPVANSEQQIGGLRLLGGDVILRQGGDTTLENAQLALPHALAPPNGPAPSMPLPAMSADQVTNADTSTFTAPPFTVSLPGLDLGNISFTHQDDGTWTGSLDLNLLGSGYNIHADPPEPNGIGLNSDGSFAFAGATTDLPPGAVPVPPFFYLSSVGLNVRTHPTAVGGSGTLQSDVPGVIEIDGCLKVLIATSDDVGKSVPLCDTTYTVNNSGTVVRLWGGLKLLGFDLLNAFVQYDSSAGWVTFGASADYKLLDDAFEIKASVDGGIKDIHNWFGELRGPSICAWWLHLPCLNTVDAYISSRGIAGCIYHAILWADVGGWYRWGEGFSVLDNLTTSCDFQTVKQEVSVADARPVRAVTARLGGGRQSVIAVTGRGSAPRVVVTGPDGRRVVDDGRPQQHYGNAIILHNDTIGITYIFLRNTSASAWKVTAQAGSTPITGMRAADAVPPPTVTGRVTGVGRHRVLHYRVAHPGTSQVQFAEQGPGAGGMIGRAKGISGAIAFTTADGPAGTRAIVAEITNRGIPGKRLTIAHFRAPAPFVPPAPRKVLLARHGRALTVRWTRVRGAAKYLVTIALTNGHRRTRTVSGRIRSVRFGPLARTTGAIAVVISVAADTRYGPPRAAALAGHPSAPRKPLSL